MIKRLSHIGVKVKDIEETIKIFEDLLGFEPWRHGIMDHPDEGMRNIKLSVGNTDIDIEILQPTDPNSHIGRSVERRGEGLYHLCFITDDLNAEMKRLKAKGIEIIENLPRPTIPSHTFWIHPRFTKGVLIEVTERPSK